jgi:hypothetical protein
MRLLHRYPDEAPLEGRREVLRPQLGRRHRGTCAAMSESAQRSQDRPPRFVAGSPPAGVEERDGVIIVIPVGALRDPLPAGLVEQLEALMVGRPVIVDLSEITLVSAAPVMGLAGWVLGASPQPDQCCLVCPRATARALLRRWHVTRSLAVFGSVADALQARRFGDEGYGAGWHPDPPGRPRSDPAVDCLQAIVKHFEKHNRPAAPAQTGGRWSPAVLASLETQGLITTQPEGWVPTMLGLRKVDALTRSSNPGNEDSETGS